MKLSARHRRTLEALWADPVRANIEWLAIEALLMALGAERFEREGSRVAFLLNECLAVFHRPHPQKEAGKPMVRSVREFLNNAGITSERER